MRNKLTTHETVPRVTLGGWRNGLLTSSAARRVRYHTSPSYLAKRSHSLIILTRKRRRRGGEKLSGMARIKREGGTDKWIIEY